MGTYFPMSNNQGDATTMLYQRDSLPTSHSETGNMVMYMNFNSSSSSLPYSDVQSVAPDSNSSQQEILLNFGGSRAVENHLWKNGENEMLMMGEQAGGNLQGGQNLQGQGLLSLSLSTQVPIIQYQNNDNPDFSSLISHNNALISNRGRNMSFDNGEDGFQNKQSRDNDYDYNDVVNDGIPSIARGIPNSKYLKAAQQLLDEVVNVKKAMKGQNGKKDSMKEGDEGGIGDGANSDNSSVKNKADGNDANELSVAEKQELQNKTTKLLSMLDEVDRRYRQYYHQMQIVVSSFDVIAGSGAAKPYTALALQTISRHFRCLRDAINGQILSARKGLGEEDISSSDKGVGISRLRYVDKQLRQQRALQQLGMMQQHPWRPQRGLPETSVSILRAWLFEHFLHPYPKDSDKIMLARQTGLTRSQVSNWFINARVRLWKPMVEEMYKEEAGDNADMHSISSSETTPRPSKTATDSISEDHLQQQQQEAAKSHQSTDVEMIGSSDANNSIFPDSMRYDLGGTREEQRRHINDSSRFFSISGSDRFIPAYHVAEMERFGGGIGGVSLTLGLQQCEGGGGGAAMGGDGFLHLRDGDVYNTTSFT